MQVEGYPVQVKESFHKGSLVQRKPEFDDCVLVADKTGLSLSDVRNRALGAAENLEE